MKFHKFSKMVELDLSSNNLTEFPKQVKDFPSLRILRLIYNQIKIIPNEFFQSDSMKANLQQLIMNANPLIELNSLIRYLKALKVLGIAHSKIQELPSSIAELELKTIVVENTPLRVPKLVTAERGFQAIKEFFEEQNKKQKAHTDESDDEDDKAP
mmetsp:Transcript_17606/g.16831  ORF Transcript_17606/g.16831 Transcript_17606/m.16831 type:complete len:156 (+) Transcript_17606:267-734(+)